MAADGYMNKRNTNKLNEMESYADGWKPNTRANSYVPRRDTIIQHVHIPGPQCNNGNLYVATDYARPAITTEEGETFKEHESCPEVMPPKVEAFITKIQTEASQYPPSNTTRHPSSTTAFSWQQSTPNSNGIKSIGGRWNQPIGHTIQNENSGSNNYYRRNESTIGAPILTDKQGAGWEKPSPSYSTGRTMLPPHPLTSPTENIDEAVALLKQSVNTISINTSVPQAQLFRAPPMKKVDSIDNHDNLSGGTEYARPAKTAEEGELFKHHDNKGGTEYTRAAKTTEEGELFKNHDNKWRHLEVSPQKAEAVIPKIETEVSQYPLRNTIFLPRSTTASSSQQSTPNSNDSKNIGGERNQTIVNTIQDEKPRYNMYYRKNDNMTGAPNLTDKQGTGTTGCEMPRPTDNKRWTMPPPQPIATPTDNISEVVALPKQPVNTNYCKNDSMMGAPTLTDKQGTGTTGWERTKPADNKRWTTPLPQPFATPTNNISEVVALPKQSVNTNSSSINTTSPEAQLFRASPMKKVDSVGKEEAATQYRRPAFTAITEAKKETIDSTEAMKKYNGMLVPY